MYCQSQLFVYFFYCWLFFFAEIIEYSTIIIESALDTDTDKMHPGSIIQHYEIETTPSHNNHTSNEDNDNDHDHEHEATMTITKVHFEPTTMCSKSVNNHIITTTTTTTSPTRTTMAHSSKEVVSYQRFGRVDKKSITYPFKCHLCGFSCRFKESLLSHFKKVHPY